MTTVSSSTGRAISVEARGTKWGIFPKADPDHDADRFWESTPLKDAVAAVIDARSGERFTYRWLFPTEAEAVAAAERALAIADGKTAQ